MPDIKTLALDKRARLRSLLTNPRYLMVYATIGIFLLIYLFGALLYGSKGFTSVRTFMLFFSDNAYIGISAVGMTLVLITGGIDLSVAAVASLTGMIIAYGTSVLGVHPVPQCAALHHHPDGHVLCPGRHLPHQPGIHLHQAQHD